jgi:hypothetical protein
MRWSLFLVASPFLAVRGMGFTSWGLDCVYCRIAFTEFFPDMPMKSA